MSNAVKVAPNSFVLTPEHRGSLAFGEDLIA
jgi:hypothetical protein